MCGRARQSLRPQQYASITGIAEERWKDLYLYEPRYNFGPGMWLPVIRRNGGDGEAAIQTMRWGLVPSFHKQEEKLDFFKMFNARSETLGSSPVFRRLLPSKRCVVLLNGFYEWHKKAGAQKQPYYIHRGPLMACAGLYDICSGPDGVPLYTFTICTTDSSSPLQWLHDRMPVILPDKAAVEAWLGAALPESCIIQEDGTVSDSDFEARASSATPPKQAQEVARAPAGALQHAAQGPPSQPTPVKVEEATPPATSGGISLAGTETAHVNANEGPAMAAAVETGGLCADEAAGGQGSQDKASEHLSCSKAPISSASAQDVQALVAKVCKPYAGRDLQWHPVTPDMGKTTTQGPRCCQDIRSGKGTIASFFKPKPQEKNKEGSNVKRERQEDACSTIPSSEDADDSNKKLKS